MSPSKILKICRKLPFLCSFNTFHYYFHMGRVKRTFIEQIVNCVSHPRCTYVSFCIIRLQALLGQALYTILCACTAQLLPHSMHSINIS